MSILVGQFTLFIIDPGMQYLAVRAYLFLQIVAPLLIKVVQGLWYELVLVETFAHLQLAIAVKELLLTLLGASAERSTFAQGAIGLTITEPDAVGGY